MVYLYYLLQYWGLISQGNNVLYFDRPVTLPAQAPGEPSPDEDLSADDDSLSAPMGYTPSFASNMWVCFSVVPHSLALLIALKELPF